MVIDFNDLLKDGANEVIHPRDIFITLDRNPAFSFPRDIQTEVMKLWFDQRDEQDNVIKLNVGSGKTLVGLLLLQSSLNEGVGPALFVAPDKQLVDQVISEAEELGLEVTDNPRDPSYEAGEKICVINAHKLFNGKSIFGVGDTGIKIPIGSVVIDDAHACVSTVSEQFRITLSHTEDSYKKIFHLLSEDLKQYNEARYLDIESSDPRAIMEVPFWAWTQHQSEILKVLHEHREDDSLIFSYPLLREILPQSRCIFSGQSLEIQPPFPATDLIKSFRRAKRRIYMTATLSDDSVIVTHFGANPEKLEKPIVPVSSQSMGERMILMPQELNPDLTADEIQKMLSELAQIHNVVVIVPSKYTAEHWKEYAHQILIGDNVIDGVAHLRDNHVGLTVLVNRYDGIDLPANACRVLALVDLPEVTSFAEVIDSDVLNNTSQDLRKQVERIEQGMGRGVRSNDDYCAVLLIGSKLTRRIRTNEGDKILTPATRAQLELSRGIAKRLNNPSPDDIKGVILQCLNRDPGWVKVSKQVLVGIETDDEVRLDSSKLAIRKAFDQARSNQYDQAVQTMSDAINSNNNGDQERAWLLSKKAAFQHNVDADGAQKALLAAHSLERGVLKPLGGSLYKKMEPALGEQAQNLVNNHNSRFLDPTAMKLFANELCSDLRFNTTSADKFEETVNQLSWFLGINGQRPEKEYKEGPDNMWALPNGCFLVVECKNEVTSDNGISKKDAGQLGQSIAWFEERYANTTVVPLMIHPKTKLGVAASRVQGMRIINEVKLENLRNSIAAFASELMNPDIAKSTVEVAKRLKQYGLNAEAFVNTFTVPVRV